ncbi:hypothetical protein [Nonomuraea indica]|uniref:hypothetical protein n=1 Tax=Nonomuraea indica TaxID=1581193 RepID=UPI001182C6C4|nr:hypothetical protein [Nonomuraea indica]
MERDDHANRLAKLMETRRLALHLMWEDVAQAAGITTAFLRKIRSGAGARPLTKAKLEAVLQWAPGSIDAILEGGDPTDLTTAGTDTGGDAEAAIRDLAPQLSPEQLRSIFGALTRSERQYEDDAEQHIWETPGLSERERRFLIHQLHALRRMDETEHRSASARPTADVHEFRRGS